MNAYIDYEGMSFVISQLGHGAHFGLRFLALSSIGRRTLICPYGAGDRPNKWARLRLYQPAPWSLTPKIAPSPYLVTWISRPLDSLIFLISAEEEGGGVREDPLDIHFSLYPSRT